MSNESHKPLKHLVSSSQIKKNLKRTTHKDLFSVLNQNELEWLAYKYFGVKDSNGNIIGYQCPYSGKIFTNNKGLILEHIIPVNSGGGTVLFNCIPASAETNSISEKGARHLIEWWTKSSYWNQKAYNRLEKLVNYMLEAYEIVFLKTSQEELEVTYQIEENKDESQDDDLTENARIEAKKLKEQAERNGIHSYLGFINDCIQCLKNNNIDITTINKKLATLEKNNIFGNIERYGLFQNILKEIIKMKIPDEDYNYLLYTINIDIKKLIDSFTTSDEKQIIKELYDRISNLEEILEKQSITLSDYFKNTRDISEIDILYKPINIITQEDIELFIKRIKLGKESMIKKFINMLNCGNNKILSQINKEKFEGTELLVGQFYNHNKIRIHQILFEETKNNREFDQARKAIKEYIEKYKEKNEKSKQSKELDLEKKIPIFIEMLNTGNMDILSRKSAETITFEGTNIIIKTFYENNKPRIQYILFESDEYDKEYDMARQTVLKFHKVSSYEELKQKIKEEKINRLLDKANAIDRESKIKKFIEMLNRGNSEILNQTTKEKFEGTNIEIGNFYQLHKIEIQKLLFTTEEYAIGYDQARKTIKDFIEKYKEKNEKTKRSREIDPNEKIKIFIEMLNKGNNEILNQTTKEKFEGTDIEISNFYQLHKDEIQEMLFTTKEYAIGYDQARKAIKDFIEKYQDKYEKSKQSKELDLEKKIPIFIEMLNTGNMDILSRKKAETITFEGTNIIIKTFYDNNKPRIQYMLFESDEYANGYEVARQTVLKFHKVSSYEELKEKNAKSKRLRDVKELKKELEKGIKALDDIDLSKSPQRRSA